MTQVRFADGRSVDVRAGETLLDACRRSGVTIAFSCGAGVCQTCLLKAVDGALPAAAQKGLAPELRSHGYLLACLCEPEGPLVLREPDPADQRVEALLHEAAAAAAFVYVRFETARVLDCSAGQRLELVCEGGPPLALQVTATRPDECVVEGLCDGAEAAARALGALTFGTALQVRGPLEARAPARELEAPPADPALWDELGQGAVMSDVLRAFYTRVYADPRLAPFFAGITMQRSIEKQFSFMKQLITGERVYFGDRPRNAHHWMVISDALFDYRQALMREELERHGLTESQIARWTRLEVHWRADIVKSAPWPRRVGAVELPVEGYGEETLAEGTICDHCGGVVDPGTVVRYHLRLGTVSCPSCVRA